MPYRVTQFQPTPNPNAIKCLLDRAVRDPALGSASFRERAGFEGDPVAESLFAIEGVANLLIASDWITVGKSPQATWARIKPQVERALAGLP